MVAEFSQSSPLAGETSANKGNALAKQGGGISLQIKEGGLLGG